ncbi:unnamed protein product [Effrenium voratum]|nr:unnamed protein product [Effrenium voratum]
MWTYVQAGELWKAMSEGEKQEFEVQARSLKSEYDKRMSLFKAQGGVVTRKRPAEAKEDKPRRPAGGAYGCFLAAEREEIAKSLPEGHKMTDVGKAAGERWRSLTEEEKQPYEEEYQKKLAEYKEAKQSYEETRTIDLVELARPNKKAMAGA